MKEFSRITYFFHFCKSLFIGIFYALKRLALVLFKKQKDIAGQLALVTGGANGLGREICLQFAKHGCDVVIADIDEEASKRTVKDCKKFNIRAGYFKTDVSDPKAVEILRKNIEKEFGHVDILVNNAGILFNSPFVNEVPEKISRMFDINLMSVLWNTREFLPSMITRRKGHIATVCSMSAYVPTPGDVTYSTTKYALRGFMESIDHDIYYQGLSDYIKTTVIYPYFMRTNKGIEEHIDVVCRHSFLLEPLEVAEALLNGILYEKSAIALPKPFETLFYLNFPRYFWKVYIETTFNTDQECIKWKIHDLNKVE